MSNTIKKTSRKATGKPQDQAKGHADGQANGKSGGAGTEPVLDVELAGKVGDAKPAPFLRREADASSMQAIEMSIRRDLEDGRKLDRATAFVSVRLGIALQAGKALVQHGLFESWVEKSFEALSVRQAQYFLKLGKVFLAEKNSILRLPQAGQVGTYLVKAGEQSPLGIQVSDFVGNKSMPELMAHYGIKAGGTKPGGFRPSNYMVAQYQGEHEELARRPFEQWPSKTQAEFREWQTKQVRSGDAADATRVAAEMKWASMADSLAEHGVRRKSHLYLTKNQAKQTRDLLAMVIQNLEEMLK